MSRTIEERLYKLLPAIHRIRDTERAEPLRALLAVMEQELLAIEDDIEGLYQNLFIETCDEWVIPYIGDLLGVRPLRTIEAEGFSGRGYVANTIAYRRRKGTAAVLEQLSLDVTGWPTRAVELFQRLSVTQHLDHLRLDRATTIDLRDANRLELLGGALGREGHTGEVRSIALGRGLYNIRNVGLFVWRLRPYRLKGVNARRETEGSTPGRYHFHPMGFELALCNDPASEEDIDELAQERNLPVELRRRALYDELASVDGPESLPEQGYFTKDRQVLRVAYYLGEETIEVEPWEMVICNHDGDPAADWHRPEGDKVVAVDPQTGRVAFRADLDPKEVLVDYTETFSGNLGAGPYDRRATLGDRIDELDFHVGVSATEHALDTEAVFSSLAEAVAAWNAQLEPGRSGLITVMDSRTYREPLTEAAGVPVRLRPGCTLRIVAADWPGRDKGEGIGSKERPLGWLNPKGVRPHLIWDIEVAAMGGGEQASDSPKLLLDGLLVEGGVRVVAGDLGSLEIDHCTLAPGFGGVSVEAGSNARLRLKLARTICDMVDVPSDIVSLQTEDCLIDEAGINATDTDATIESTTVFGAVSVRQIEGSNSIFLGSVEVRHQQEGCLRFCYAPDQGRTPRRHRCQPDLALAARKGIAEVTGSMLDAADLAQVRSEVKPSFTSDRFGAPGYGQLSPTCAEEIRTGAEDGSEMGAFRMLGQTHREKNLETALREYLRFGLEVGLIYVT